MERRIKSHDDSNCSILVPKSPDSGIRFISTFDNKGGGQWRICQMNKANSPSPFFAIFRHLQFLKSDISDIKEMNIYNHFSTVYISMSAVTLQSFKMIGRLKVGKLGRGPQIL